MARTRTGVTRRRRHNKILKATKGYWGARSKLYKTAHEAYLHAGEYAFAGRRLRRRDMRRLWIQRINAGLRSHDLSYSKFIHQLKNANIDLNRKTLADLAVTEPETFKNLIQRVRSK